MTPEPRSVYLFAGPNGLFKIGQTHHPNQRVQQYAKRSGVRLVCSAEIGTHAGEATRLEFFLHKAFAHRRARAEWFRLAIEDVALLTYTLENDALGIRQFCDLCELYQKNEANQFRWGEADYVTDEDFAFLTRPPKKHRLREPTELIRVPRSFSKKLRLLVSHLDMDPGDYIADRLATTLDKDEKEMLKDIAKEQKGE